MNITRKMIQNIIDSNRPVALIQLLMEYRKNKNKQNKLDKQEKLQEGLLDCYQALRKIGMPITVNINRSNPLENHLSLEKVLTLFPL